MRKYYDLKNKYESENRTMFVNRYKKAKANMNFIQFRSYLVSEYCDIRLGVFKELLKMQPNSSLPSKYRSLFFDQFFELKNDRIKIPSAYKTYEECIIKMQKRLDYYNTSKTFSYFNNKNDITDNEITVKNSDVYTLINHNLSINKNSISKIFIPIIILNERLVNILVETLSLYIRLLECNDLLNRFLCKVNPTSLISKHKYIYDKEKKKYPSLSLDGNIMHVLFIEELVNLEVELINRLVKRFHNLALDEIDNRKAKGLYMPREPDRVEQKIWMYITEINSNVKIKELSNFNIDRQREIHYKIEELEKNKKGPKALKGYENNKKPYSWEDVFIYYIESQNEFFYYFNRKKRIMKLSDEPKKMLYKLLLIDGKVIPDKTHEKRSFGRLNTQLKQSFKKKDRPIDYNADQKVYTIKFKHEILNNYDDIKTLNMTKEEIELIQDSSYHSKRIDLPDEENPSYD